MSQSKSIFGKNIFDLNYQDIECFFQSEKEENLNLEFKAYVDKGSYSDKEKVIKKSVCALLNSEGGIIIWGAPIERRDKFGNTKAVGGLTPFKTSLDKDKLINILSSSIVPMPIGINVNFLNNDNDSFVVVIEVLKSIERPHQFDNRYYVRLDGQTRIAPHYLISALMKSQDFPIIRGHIRLKGISMSENDVFAYFRYVLFNTSQFNNEKNAYYKIIVYPGNIFINEDFIGHTYEHTVPIISHGRPIMYHFMVQIPSKDAHKNLEILFQFGGEKSPSKISKYEYNLSANLLLGDVANESIYLVEKRENTLPSDFSNNTDDDHVNQLLDT